MSHARTSKCPGLVLFPDNNLVGVWCFCLSLVLLLIRYRPDKQTGRERLIAYPKGTLGASKHTYADCLTHMTLSHHDGKRPDSHAPQSWHFFSHHLHPNSIDLLPFVQSESMRIPRQYLISPPTIKLIGHVLNHPQDNNIVKRNIALFFSTQLSFLTYARHPLLSARLPFVP